MPDIAVVTIRLERLTTSVIGGIEFEVNISFTKNSCELSVCVPVVIPPVLFMAMNGGRV